MQWSASHGEGGRRTGREGASRELTAQGEVRGLFQSGAARRAVSRCPYAPVRSGCVRGCSVCETFRGELLLGCDSGWRLAWSVDILKSCVFPDRLRACDRNVMWVRITDMDCRCFLKYMCYIRNRCLRLYDCFVVVVPGADSARLQRRKIVTHGWEPVRRPDERRPEGDL